MKSKPFHSLGMTKLGLLLKTLISRHDRGKSPNQRIELPTDSL